MQDFFLTNYSDIKFLEKYKKIDNITGKLKAVAFCTNIAHAETVCLLSLKDINK